MISFIGFAYFIPCVIATPSFDYTLTLQNPDIQLIPGYKETTKVFVNQSGNHSGTVMLQGTWIGQEVKEISIDIEPNVGTIPFSCTVSFASSIYTTPGFYSYEICASSENTNHTTQVNVTITTDLAVALFTDKEDYQKGQEIHIYGNATTMHHDPVISGDVHIFIQTPQRNISFLSLIHNQSFDVYYPISYGEEEGTWDIEVRVIDDENHVGIQTKNIIVSLPVHTIRYVVGFFSPPNTAVYQRGESLTISVYVTEDSSHVQNANTTCVTPSLEKIQLLEYAPGLYKNEYTIPWDTPVGESFFIVESIKNISGNATAGGSSVSIFIEPTPLHLTVIEPSVTQFSPNSRIPLKVEVQYRDGAPVTEAQLTATIPTGNITLQHQQNGMYTANVSLSNQNTGNQVFDITAVDAYGNAGSTKKIVFITVESPSTITLTLVPLILVVFCCTLSLYFIRRYYKLNRLTVIREEMQETQRLQEEAVNKYYKEGVISKQVYDALIFEHAQRYAHLQKEERKISKK
jgi:hypothetical protein